MRKVIGIGETVLDIIFRNDKPIGAVPGGSVFNGIISLGRAGIPTTFISEAGNDRLGRQIIRFLETNGVDATHLNVYPDSKTAISLAFLNERDDAEYLFYKDHPHDQLEFAYPDVQPDDVVMFGSFYAVNPVIRPQVVGFLEYARNRGAILYYDVNFRPSHRQDVIRVTPNLLENFELADFVRGSVDDFEVLFRKTDPDTIYRSDISFYTKKFICTHGSNPVELRAENGFRRQYPVLQTETVSTIGAGDNFNAGCVCGPIHYGITREVVERGLSPEQWDEVVHQAQLFSANCCQSIDNSISVDFGRQLQQSARP